MRAILNILEHDFRMFFRYKWWLAGLISMNLADLFIMAVVYTGMIREDIFGELFNYFKFFSPGITITALFAAAFMIGREVNFEQRRSFSHYMLSLPMTRLELAVGRVLSGGIRGMVYMSPLLLTTFIFLGLPTLPQLLIILGVLFAIAIGISGLSIALAVSTKSFEKFVTSRGVVYYLLFFASTIFYPMRSPQLLTQLQGIVPQPIITLALINPLSCGADLIRSYLLNEPPFSIDFIVNVLIFSAIFTVGSAVAYIKMIERD